MNVPDFEKFLDAAPNYTVRVGAAIVALCWCAGARAATADKFTQDMLDEEARKLRACVTRDCGTPDHGAAPPAPQAESSRSVAGHTGGKVR